MRKTPWVLGGMMCVTLSFAQINYTADNKIVANREFFGFGTNMGAYPGWTDDQLADIAAGNASKKVAGAGVTALRPFLPEEFLDFWGYDIRVDVFQHYARLGLRNNTVPIGFPAKTHRDTSRYCPQEASALFANLYDDIWDDGRNGTPVNERNYYAKYVYETVRRYKGAVRYWQVWNEPDFDFSNHAWLQPGEPGSWWENNPEPCDYVLKAPIFHYIRLLRITYEVVKTLDPEAYVTVGGLGYPSFLDAVLRNTDNPKDGSVTAQYPLKGGAWFDALSYHSYPHYDGSLQYWSNAAGGFVYERHSDRAIDGLLKRKKIFEDVLKKYGYDDSKFPAKHWLVTESNLPRRDLGFGFGSAEAQRNYVMKAPVACMQNGIDQFHVYSLAESKTEKEAGFEFEQMGLYQYLGATPPYQQKILDSGTAYKTISDCLRNSRYDEDETKALELPSGIRGGAFVDAAGKFTYVLWAETNKDKSEQVAKTLDNRHLSRHQWLETYAWDYSRTQKSRTLSAQSLRLTGEPLILKPAGKPNEPPPSKPDTLQFRVFANPTFDWVNITFSLTTPTPVHLSVTDVQGRLLEQPLQGDALDAGDHRLTVERHNWPSGIYFVKFQSQQQEIARKVVILRRE